MATIVLSPHTLAKDRSDIKAEVTSSNTVGYQKLGLSAESYKIGGVQFVKTTSAAANLNELFASSGIPYGTKILFLNPNGSYATYTFIEEAYDEDADDFVPGWADGSDYLVTSVSNPGLGFWAFSTTAIDLIQIGQVDDQESRTLSIPAESYFLFSNVRPKGFNPNDADLGWENLEYGTKILALTPSGSYATYTYIEEAYDEDADDFVPGWADGADYLVTAPIIAPGEGAWIYSKKPLTLTFNN